MHYVKPATPFGRLSEKQKGVSRFQAFIIPFDAFEEHHFHPSAAIVNYDTEAFCRPQWNWTACRHGRAASRPDQRGRYHRALNLNIGKVSPDFSDWCDAAPVDIAEGIYVQQVVERFDAEFGLEERGPLWSHSAQKLYVRIQRR